jgi:hypothetical protein
LGANTGHSRSIAITLLLVTTCIDGYPSAAIQLEGLLVARFHQGGAFQPGFLIWFEGKTPQFSLYREK